MMLIIIQTLVVFKAIYHTLNKNLIAIDARNPLIEMA